MVLIGEAEEDQREQGCTKAQGGKELGVLEQQRGGQRWSRAGHGEDQVAGPPRGAPDTPAWVGEFTLRALGND